MAAGSFQDGNSNCCVPRTGCSGVVKTCMSGTAAIIRAVISRRLKPRSTHNVACSGTQSLGISVTTAVEASLIDINLYTKTIYCQVYRTITRSAVFQNPFHL